MKKSSNAGQKGGQRVQERENPAGTGSRNVDNIDNANNENEITNKGDITREDLEALGPVDLSMDMGDDEDLKHREFPVDFSASDLDIPGTDLDDESESYGSEDEENNHYSIGGDNGV